MKISDMCSPEGRLGDYLNTMVADLKIEGKGQYLRDLFGRFYSEVCAAQTAEVRPNTVQQLKAEIAALANEINDINGSDCAGNMRLVSVSTKMRQLSAI